MKRLRWVLSVVLAALAALVLAWLVVSREGGCDRDPPPDDDDGMEPACKPGDKECYGAAPPRDLPAPG